MSRKELADRLEMDCEQIRDFERGANRLSSGRIWQIAFALEVSVAWFFEGLAGEVRGGRGTGGDVLVDPEARDLVRMSCALSETQRRRLFDLAHVLGHAASGKPPPSGGGPRASPA